MKDGLGRAFGHKNIAKTYVVKLQWFGNVERRDKNYIANKNLIDVRQKETRKVETELGRHCDRGSQRAGI